MIFRQIALLLAVLTFWLVNGTVPRAASTTSPRPIQVGQIPSDATVAFLMTKRRGETGQLPLHDVYVTNQYDQRITQITFHTESRFLEHVSVSPDRKRIALVSSLKDPGAVPRHRFLLWVLDLQNQTEAQLVPDFHSAGGGGVDWDHRGFIYFPAIRERATPGTMPESDLYKIRYDGTGLRQLTKSPGLEADVAVSEDGTLVTYALAIPKPPPGITELWIARTDGTNARLVYRSGQVRVNSAHDPEFSPDNRSLIFSQVNPEHNNFSGTYNTAHDVYVIKVDGSGLRRITPAGGIQIMPDWLGDKVVYTDLNEADEYRGMAMIDLSGRNRIRFGPMLARTPKWIPPLQSVSPQGAAQDSQSYPAAAAQPFSSDAAQPYSFAGASPSSGSAQSQDSDRRRSGGPRHIIMAIQNLLASLGYDPGPANGAIGPKTRSSISRFQASRGLEENGHPSPELLLELSEAVRGNR